MVVAEEESGSGGSEGGDSEGAGGNGDGGSAGSGSDNNNTCNCNPGEAPSICAVVGSEGILVAHENCNQFYTCSNGLPVVQSCPVNLLYNPYTEQCDWPENVQCGDRVIPEDGDNGDSGSGGEESGGGGSGGSDSEGAGSNGDSGSGGSGSDNNNTCNCNPGEAPSICAVEGSEGVLVAHENCNQFYTCSNGLPVVQSCPVNLLYNPYTEQCDWPDNVQCGDRVIPEDCDDGDSNSSGEESGGGGSGGGDSEDGGSNGDGGSGGSGSDNNNTCNCNPGEAPSICAVEGSEGILVAHENCNQFYKCSNGLPVIQSCPVNLLYNPYTEQCDWPENVQCGDRVIPEDGDNGDSGSGGEENGGDGSGGGDSEDGGSNGDSGSGGSGSDNNNTCNCNPGEAPSICAVEGSGGILVAHENCNQFYTCSNGLPVVQSCPINLLYNPYTEQCDWPENVQCGDRVIPEDSNDGDSNSSGEESGGGGSGGSDSEGAGGNGDGGSGGSGSDNNNTCNCNPGEAPSICAVEGSEGVLVAHENCNQFYKCSNGLPVIQSCPVNLLYNPYTEQCDWPENVQCGDRVIPEDGDNGDDGSGGEESGSGGSEGGDSEGAEGNGGGGSGGSGSDNNNTCNCNPGEAPSICAVVGSEGILVAHENCNQFYTCSNGLPVVQSCPVNLLYNPYTEQCDWPENVQCGDRVIPEDSNDGDSNSSGEESGGGGSGGSDSEGAGGNGDGGSGGSGSDNNNTCNCNPGEAPSICAVEGSEGILVVHENCNQFYKCSNGLPVIQSCPVNLLYNPYTEQCDWPENVQCGDRVIPEDGDNGDSGSGGEENGGDGSGGGDSEDGGSNGDSGSGGSGSDNNNTCNCNPGEAPSICAAEGSGGILVAHENCNQFYTCSNGLPVVQSCPINLLYNPYTEQCDWPENVQCGDRVIPEDSNDGDSNSSGEESGGGGSGGSDSEGAGGNGDGGSGGSGSDNNNTCNCNPGEAPSICAVEGSEGVLVAHENCNQFYKCSNGLPVIQSCPVNLLYNPYTEQCDWPENVQCGDRVIPEDGDNGDDGSGGEESGSGGSEGGDSEGAGGNGDGGSGGSGSDNNNTCNCNPGEAPSICAVVGSEGILVAHENCNQFYTCSNGLPVVQSCPVNLLYNPYTEQCDWPENVQCGDRVIPEDGNDGDSNSSGEESGGVGSGGSDSEGAGGNGDGGDNNNTCNCNPGEAPSICAVEGSEGVLVAHENCNQFYKCSNGLPVIQSCPVNLLYNPYTEQCDWPENVQCGDRVIPEDGDNGDSGSGGEENGGDGSGGGDSEGAEGNGDGGSGGSGSDNNNTCNCNPGEAPSICAVVGSEGILVAHENCNQFYTCINGLPVVQSCPVNLLYNPYTEQCDWPDNVQCGDRVIPEDSDNGDDGSGGEESGSGGSGGGDSEGAGGNGDGGSGGSGSDNNNTCNCNPGEASSICAVVGSEGILVAHENCNQFYTCINGLPVVQSCPVNLLYNPYTEQCDWPDNVQCGDRVIPEDSDNGDDGSGGEDSGSGGSGGGDSEGAGGNGDGGSGGSGSDNNNTCNCNPGEAPSICAVVGSEGILVAHENCNQFYTCINGLPVVQSCPVNLLYNPYTEQCDWPDNVQCGDRVIPEDCDDGDSNSGGEESVGGDSESGGANGGGESEGSGSENNNTCNCNPGEAPSICAVEGSEGILVAHENCNQFYTCSNGLPLVQSCPVNLLYNPYTEQCDWPDNVQCGDRVIPEDSDDGDSNSSGEESVGGDSESGGGNGDGISGGGGSDNNNTCNCDPGEAPTICAADGSEGILVAHENCNQFYICSNGLPVVQSCPVNLLYNPYTEQCDWPANVQCGDRVIPEDCGNGDSGSDGGENEGGDSGSESGDSDNNNTCNCNPRKAPSICAVEGSEGVLVAHENCNQFYTCSNGLPVVQNCPVNLLYNPYTERCDWPDKVDCGNRIISDNEKENNDAEDIKPESGNSDPSKAPAICATEGSDGVLIAHEICNQFYKCYEGIPVVFNCSPNLLYNPVHEWCDWAQNVDCGDRIQ
ncbi:unnamed protein product [Parnassius apollo]|uniref:(apollo) hypothetical protein n=1 Tax=Parnassius apollo TaxID=110799 RepID=A0A8S3W647_PARAO|nr:unnamed protein product [Parnassius apollo]